MSVNHTEEPSDTPRDIDELRQQILKLRQEVQDMKEMTAEAEETLRNLNKLVKRIEDRKKARSENENK